MRRFILTNFLCGLLIGCGGDNHHKRVPDQWVPGVVENTPSPLPPPTRTETQVKLGELTCIDMGGHITNCALADKVLAEKQGVLTKFTLTYDFACIGDNLSIVIAIDGTETALKQESPVTLTLYGFGAVVLKTSNAEATKDAYLQVGCKLEFTDIKIEAA